MTNRLIVRSFVLGWTAVLPSSCLDVTDDDWPDYMSVAASPLIPRDSVFHQSSPASEGGADLFRPHAPVQVGDGFWVAERDRIWRFDSTFAMASEIAPEGEGPGEVRGVWTVLPVGDRVVVNEFTNGRLSLFDTTGFYLESYSLPKNPMGIAGAPGWPLAVAVDDSLHYAIRLEEGGPVPFARRPSILEEMRTEEPERFMRAWPDLAMTADGRLHVLDNTVGALIRFTPTGEADLMRLLPFDLRKTALDGREAMARGMKGAFLGMSLTRGVAATIDGRLLIHLPEYREHRAVALIVDPVTYEAVALHLPSSDVATEPIWKAGELTLDGNRLYVATDTAIMEYRVHQKGEG